jgi:hypothetical protein
MIPEGKEGKGGIPCVRAFSASLGKRPQGLGLCVIPSFHHFPFLGREPEKKAHQNKRGIAVMTAKV